MILTNRLFDRVEPDKEAKSIFIFGEGAKREYQYFQYFRSKDSRINIEIYPLEHSENNSPAGLLEIARTAIVKSESNKNPKYDFQIGDEVWIVVDYDTDREKSRMPQFQAIKEFCVDKENWNLVISNPCFEVWLIFHVLESIESFEDDHLSTSWKKKVHEVISGGFHSSRHPIYIEAATRNAKNNYEVEEDMVKVGSTEVWELGESILTILKDKIDLILEQVET
jgi:hypothetical protein